MIPIPTGWSATRTCEGLLLTSRGGDRVIRYCERIAPPSSLTEIVASALDGAEVIDITDPTLLETDEGEYAARISATLRSESGPVHRELGIVLLDDGYAMLDATIRDVSQLDRARATIDVLVKADTHGRGERRRWFRYEPPAGWVAERRGQETTWSIGDRKLALTVWLAVPRSLGGSAESAAVAMFTQDVEAGFSLESTSAEVPIHSDHGLSGTFMTLRGRFPTLPVTERALVLLEDRKFTYMLKLEAADRLNSDDLDILGRVVASIHPLPDRRTADHDVFTHWAA